MKKSYSKYSDIELYACLQGSKEESEAAFGELYTRYSQRIFAYCLRVTCNNEDARDIFQETFIKFFNSAKQHKKLENVPGFLLTIARNLCLNFKRDRKFTYQIQDFNVASTESNYEQKEMLQLISSALELLDFESREAFILRQYHGFSYKEISDITNEPPSKIKNRVWRAKEKIKNILSPYLEDVSNI